MKIKKVTTAMIIIFLLITNISVAFSRDLAMENYRQGILAFETQDWSEARYYFDEVIMNDFQYSEYRAKSIYLKTILLAAEIDKNLELSQAFMLGEERVEFTNKELIKEFSLKKQNYQLQAEQKVDTLIGLANYLVNNLQPLNLNLEIHNINSNPNYSIVNKIKAGNQISNKDLDYLEEIIFLEKVNKYLSLTLNGESFNNLFVVRAEEGDNLYYLAQKYNVPLQLLIDVNNHIKNPDRIYPTEKVYIPRVDAYFINYPAYFYYLAETSYRANPSRNEDISRLVFKAYQLTSANDSSVNGSNYTQLDEDIKNYQEKINLQAEQLKVQEEDLEKVRNKYNQLIAELKEIKEVLENKKENKKENSFYDFDNSEDIKYNPDQDSLDY